MKLELIELFAGVGGFRVAFESVNSKSVQWNTVFANQWEPGTGANFLKGSSNQFAYNTYLKHFGDKSYCLNENVELINAKSIPNHSLLVGGFPCQDYSVYTTNAKGLEGKKGVLWWEIYRIIEEKKSPFLLLENVDRLLLSPTKQRGRDFGIILSCLDKLEYNVEWRVINAAEYGHVQKRRRIFIFAYKRSTIYAKKNKNLHLDKLVEGSFFPKIFPVQQEFVMNRNKKISLNKIYGRATRVPKCIEKISNNFNETMYNAGIMINGEVVTGHVKPSYKGSIKLLGDIVEDAKVNDEFFLNQKQIEKMDYLKGHKTIDRISKEGFQYKYSEGKMNFPDCLNTPARTLVTSEGSMGRSSHIVEDLKSKKPRFITPLEAERINGFPDNWTIGLTKRQRFFCMGNALVVPLVKEMAFEITEIIKLEE